MDDTGEINTVNKTNEIGRLENMPHVSRLLEAAIINLTKRTVDSHMGTYSPKDIKQEIMCTINEREDSIQGDIEMLREGLRSLRNEINTKLDKAHNPEFEKDLWAALDNTACLIHMINKQIGASIDELVPKSIISALQTKEIIQAICNSDTVQNYVNNFVRSMMPHFVASYMSDNKSANQSSVNIDKTLALILSKLKDISNAQQKLQQEKI